MNPGSHPLRHCEFRSTSLIRTHYLHIGNDKNGNQTDSSSRFTTEATVAHIWLYSFIVSRRKQQIRFLPSDSKRTKWHRALCVSFTSDCNWRRSALSGSGKRALCKEALHGDLWCRT